MKKIDNQREKLGNVLKYIPCHRKPERCLKYKGNPLPICARCMGVLGGYLVFPLFFLIHISMVWGILLQVPMLMDGFTQMLKLRISNNGLRVVTGLFSGVGMSIFIVGMVRVLTGV